MMKIRVDRASGVPLHDQIKEEIKGLIYAGQLRSGDQLPTMRSLSIELGVNFNTVALAYRELDTEGILVAERGKGTFVALAPGVAERRRLRHKKLHALLDAFFDSANRLGYGTDEIRQAIEEWMAS